MAERGSGLRLEEGLPLLVDGRAGVVGKGLEELAKLPRNDSVLTAALGASILIGHALTSRCLLAERTEMRTFWTWLRPTKPCTAWQRSTQRVPNAKPV